MEQLIAELIQSAFTSDEQAWFELLGTDTSSTTDEQLEQFLAVVDGVNRVFDTVNTEDHEEINEEQLDEIARLVFQTQELRTALASTVSGLIQQAGSGIETPKQQRSGSWR